MSHDLPLREDLIAAPKTCEMCGQMVEPDARTLSTAEAPLEVLRYLSALWFEDRLAAQIVLLRIGAPDWSYRQIADQLQTSRASVGRSIQDMRRARPELAGLVNIYCAAPIAQTRRRTREAATTCGAELRELRQEFKDVSRSYRRTPASGRTFLPPNLLFFYLFA